MGIASLGLTLWVLASLYSSAPVQAQPAGSISQRFPNKNFWDCSVNSRAARDVIARVCDCNTPSRNCNPFCPASYIECGACPKRFWWFKRGRRRRCVHPVDRIVRCAPGQVFDFVEKKCVGFGRATNVCEFKGQTDDDADDGGGADPFCNVECFCQGKATGVYPNPFDAFCQSSIRCNAATPDFPEVSFCGFGQRFNAVTKTCRPASSVSCNTGSSPLPEDSCQDEVCFCKFRAAGVYDNPFDFDANSAILCGPCGEFLNVFIGRPGFVFNGVDFVAPTRPKPQLCGQLSGGVRASALAIIGEFFNTSTPAAGRRRLHSMGARIPEGMPEGIGPDLGLQDEDVHMHMGLHPVLGEDFIVYNGTCGRTLKQAVPRNSVQAVPVSGCSSRLRCPGNVISGYRRITISRNNCRLVKCARGCGILASSRNYCPAPRPPAG